MFSPTEASVAWNDSGLHVLYRIFGSFREATDDGKDPMTILPDDRVECFIQPPSTEWYCAYEVNRACRALSFRAKFIRNFDYKWTGNHFSLLGSDIVDKNTNNETSRYMTISIPWKDLDLANTTLKPLPRTGYKIGLYRAEGYEDKATGKWEMIWTSWVDPNSKDVNFHCPETFASLELLD